MCLVRPSGTTAGRMGASELDQVCLARKKPARSGKAIAAPTHEQHYEIALTVCMP